MSTLTLSEKFSTGLNEFLSQFPSDGLYAPIHYLLNIHGKRIRPLLALSVCEAEGSSIDKALPSAIAVELFHNFTLMHDDIMDKAPLRRGQLTAHKVYGEDSAILSGDAMFALASISLEDVNESALLEILKIYNRTSREVCEGQQLDMEYEKMNDVTIDHYLEMIRLKTSVLLACSCAMGAISAGASKERVELWYKFGEQTGLAFQIQDDLLDTFGDSEIMGKKVGGDILSEKKTFIWLYTKAQGMMPENLSSCEESAEKVSLLKSAMIESGADIAARKKMMVYTENARTALSQLDLSSDHLKTFENLLSSVTERTS
ncbi:MAG: polyprenyl synthetase family protein [Flavobacteriales bacterium]|nr:polyprenyl synthetase family protein [Flavobacteriales bacterium]